MRTIAFLKSTDLGKIQVRVIYPSWNFHKTCLVYFDQTEIVYPIRKTVTYLSHLKLRSTENRPYLSYPSIRIFKNAANKFIWGLKKLQKIKMLIRIIRIEV